jgi:uncharacterized protein YqjF (DUF2071 family)
VTIARTTGCVSEAGKERLLASPGEPLFLAEWERVVFIHYEAVPVILQQQVPFDLDIRDGHAFVSIVAFTMRRLRLRPGSRLGEWLLKPIATARFLNVRTYVLHHGEPGIYFLAEWLSNLLSVWLGPRTFGLPYRFGELAYEHPDDADVLRGRVAASEGLLRYHSTFPAADFSTCEAGSLTEFLVERYTAFTCCGRRHRLFRVWHEPWRQAPVDITVIVDDLIASTGAWWQGARYVGATYSPGVSVWMGRPHRSVSRSFETQDDRNRLATEHELVLSE